MNFCFVINKNYIGQFKVAAFSLFKNSFKSYDINIFILHSDLEKEDQHNLRLFVSKYGANIDFVYMDSSMFEGLPKMRSDSSYTAYFKVMIPYVLSFLDKVLYLDCDLLVKRDLQSLYSIDKGTFLCSSLDLRMNKYNSNHIKKIVGFDSKLYFNSGVVLFNFKYKDQIFDKNVVLNYIKDNKDIIIYHDQDILNHFYINKNYVLEREFNYLTIYQSFKDFLFHNDIKKAYIIHYANGNFKPWFSNYVGKGYKEYIHYYNLIKDDENLSFLNKRSFKDCFKLVIHYLKK